MTRIQATCTQYYQVNDKFFRNRYLYCTMFALFASLDTAVVYFVKLSRQKLLNAAKKSNLKS